MGSRQLPKQGAEVTCVVCGASLVWGAPNCWQTGTPPRFYCQACVKQTAVDESASPAPEGTGNREGQL